LEILKAPIENFIRDANRQIRETKKRLNMPDAKGLLLVFNQGNALHNRPKDFRLLTGSVLRKRDKDRKLGFLISTVWCTSHMTASRPNRRP